MTHTLTMKTALFATLFAGFATLASAQDIAFQDVDADRDGMLSMQEVKQALPDVSDDQLAIADANGDDMLDEAEFEVLKDE